MDSLITDPCAREARSSVQCLHVYRHVDAEKLQSKAPDERKTLISGGTRTRNPFAKTTASQAKALPTANLSANDGGQCIA